MDRPTIWRGAPRWVVHFTKVEASIQEEPLDLCNLRQWAQVQCSKSVASLQEGSLDLSNLRQRAEVQCS
jgi:hypothetical protein